ncbi:MAG: hypothetical protein LBV18_03415 [Alistipes sp.]|jgi:hypothetical protein|nr:hypothetical protein [Alistipes sp.]
MRRKMLLFLAPAVLAAGCANWSQVKTKLQQHVGTYYTQAELNTFVAPYDYWFANN